MDLIVCQLKENEKIISKPTCTGVSFPFETKPSCDRWWAGYRRYSKFYPGSSRRTTAYSASEFRKYRRSALGLGPPNRISSEFVWVIYVKSGYARIASHCNSLFGFRVSGSWTGSNKTTSKKDNAHPMLSTKQTPVCTDEAAIWWTSLPKRFKTRAGRGMYKGATIVLWDGFGKMLGKVPVPVACKRHQSSAFSCGVP